MRRTSPCFHARLGGTGVCTCRPPVQDTGKLRLDLRPPIEADSAGRYLRMSYYEKLAHGSIDAAPGQERARVAHGARGRSTDAGKREGYHSTIPRDAVASSAQGSGHSARLPAAARASNPGSASARAIFILSPILACRAMCGASRDDRARSRRVRVCGHQRHIRKARSRSIFTRCASPRASSGATGGAARFGLPRPLGRLS